MNISLSEIILVLLIALIVVKPEQLPDAAFTLGRFFKAMRRLFHKMKAEVDHFVDGPKQSDES
jgi:Sec-independent protein translocase protein TatA